MEDRNKDLPLIVAEILIEMHEMREDIKEMREDIKEMREDMKEVKHALNRTASVILKQQEHTNTLFMTLQEENKKNMEFMTYSINKALGQQQEINTEYDERLKRLEQQYK